MSKTDIRIQNARKPYRSRIREENGKLKSELLECQQDLQNSYKIIEELHEKIKTLQALVDHLRRQ